MSYKIEFLSLDGNNIDVKSENSDHWGWFVDIEINYNKTHIQFVPVNNNRLPTIKEIDSVLSMKENSNDNFEKNKKYYSMLWVCIGTSVVICILLYILL